MNKSWQYYETNDELVEQISNKFNINKLLAQILINKGIIEEKGKYDELIEKGGIFSDMYYGKLK